MHLFKFARRPKIRLLSGTVAVKDENGIQLIPTRGLVTMHSKFIESSDRSHRLFGAYSSGSQGELVERELASFSTQGNADFVIASVFSSLGSRYARWARRLTFIAVPLLLVFGLASVAGTVASARATPGFTPSLAQASGSPPQMTLEAAKASFKERLKSSAGAATAQDFVPPDYTFNPQIVTPPVKAPELKCLAKDALQATSKQ